MIMLLALCTVHDLENQEAVWRSVRVDEGGSDSDSIDGGQAMGETAHHHGVRGADAGRVWNEDTIFEDHREALGIQDRQMGTLHYVCWKLLDPHLGGVIAVADQWRLSLCSVLV